jgi:hypothetical protein
MGNRIQRNGLRFMPSIPGNWEDHSLPACAPASLLAADHDPQWKNFKAFGQHAKTRGFFFPF